MKKVIHSAQAPAPVGPYSQAIESDTMIFCSGQIALDPDSGKLVEGGIEIQTRRVLQNLSAVLQQAGLDLIDVVKTTVFLVDLADFEVLNRVYSEHFSPPYPARSTVQVAGLGLKARVEIEAIAIKRR
ncbi:MAG: putative endoribonuclease [Candidatus Binatus sp.]|nr:putative endoribonuclease [Candidatus Binatus sp.]